MSFWGELKRRNVFKVAIAYLVASWLIVQIIGVLTNPLSLPETLDTVVIVLLAIGFPFALIIAWIYEVTPEGIKVTSPADSPGQAAHRPTGARLTYVIVALLVTAVALTALQNFSLTTSPEGFGAGSRLAVLPCDDLSPDPSDSFFAVGIHEELLNRLAALHGLEVISRTSVQQYATRRPPLPQIARELDVDAIIECSARYAGDRVRLTAQLVDGASDTHLWSEAYQADMSNLQELFEIQAKIAMQVANALRIAFFEDERERIARVPTQFREAYELYLVALGNESWGDRLALLEQALALDDQFIDAWIAKAQVHNVFAGFRAGNEADAETAAAIEAINTALRIDPDSGPAHGSLAFTLGQKGDWIGAELEARRALELGTPASIPFVKMAAGNFSEAAEALEDTVRKDPVNSLTPGVLLPVYEALGDKAARRRHWERGELLFDVWLGWETESMLRLGENDTEFLRTALPASMVQSPIWRAGVANLDSPEDGLAAMQSLYANPEMRSAVNLRYLTAWALYFGDPSLALQWFRESVELQATGIFWVWLPSFTALRHEPDFKDFVRDVGLPEYWDRFGWPKFCRRIGNDDFECD